jgi:hypothetical protein
VNSPSIFFMSIETARRINWHISHREFGRILNEKSFDSTQHDLHGNALPACLIVVARGAEAGSQWRGDWTIAGFSPRGALRFPSENAVDGNRRRADHGGEMDGPRITGYHPTFFRMAVNPFRELRSARRAPPLAVAMTVAASRSASFPQVRNSDD